MLEPLVAVVEKLDADLVIISGDFVEHASTGEFEQAREYLQRLPQPQLVVPGNHDLPFYDPLKRVRQGLGKYIRFISEDLEPLYADDEMIVAGVTTPRIIPMKGGLINPGQVDGAIGRMCGDPSPRIKVLVTHHPLDLPENFTKRQLAWHARSAVERLSPCVDLMLAGHLHLSSTGATAARYRKTGHSMIFAQAGTAISMRNKGEPNSFNLIRLQQKQIEIQHYSWNEQVNEFMPCQWEQFESGARGWEKRVAPRESEQVQL